MDTSRAAVRAFGKDLKRGDVLYNKYQEHQYGPDERVLFVIKDVPGRAFFVLEDMAGKVTFMRTKTLMTRYALHPSGPRYQRFPNE